MRSVSLAVVGCLIASVVAVAPAQTFYEQNGLVVVECESVPPGDQWQRLSGNDNIGSSSRTVAGHTGPACYRFTGNSESSGPVTGIMDYKINITNAGTYRLYMRGMEAPIESGAGDQANDCYIKMVGQSGCEGQFTKFVRLGSSYEWTFGIRLECSHHTFSDPYYDLSAGTHTFQIAGRSKNFLIDRFVLINSAVSNASPTNTSLPESPTSDTGGGTTPTGCTLNAVDFANKGNFYVDNNWLAINPSNHTTATATTPFECESGTYDITFHGVGESDGQSEYELFVNGTSVGKYQVPLSSQAFEEGDAYNMTWQDVSVNNGDEIKVQAWIHSSDGQEYSRGRWLKVEFVTEGGSTTDPTVIVEPAAGTVIPMGATITLIGTGTNLSWSYDANSDGLPEVPIGSGDTVSFEVPTGVTGPQEITIYLSGAGGKVSRLYSLGSATVVPRGVRAPSGVVAPDGVVKLYGVDGRTVGEVELATGRLVGSAHRLPAGTYLIRTHQGMRLFVHGYRE